tara:strand:- start:1140 stop:1406 length:267 start_codon:yes stop_codon:yes gene_type:complete
MTDDTIQIKTRLRRTRRLKMGQNKTHPDGDPVAAIRVSGLYLQDLGFDPHGYFDMHINDDNSLTMTPISKEQAEADKAAQTAAKDAIK